MAGVIEVLDDLGAEAVYAECWYSYPIAAGTDERIVAADLLMDRYPPYRHLAEESETPIVVVDVGSPNDPTLAAIEGDVRIVVGSAAVHVLPEGISVDDLGLVPR